MASSGVLLNCRKVQESTYDLQSLAGQISRARGTCNTLKAFNRGCRQADNAVARVAEIKALFEQVSQAGSDDATALDKHNHILMRRKLRDNLYITVHVLEHLLRELIADSQKLLPTVTPDIEDGLECLLARLQPMSSDLAPMACDDEQIDIRDPANMWSTAEASWENCLGTAASHECRLLRDLPVTESCAVNSEVLVVLPAGFVVILTEVLREEQGRYLRGQLRKLAGLTGFITLCDSMYHFYSVERIRGAEVATPPEPAMQKIAVSTQELASQAMSFVATTIPELASNIPDLAGEPELPELSKDLYQTGDYVLTRDAAINAEVSFGSPRIMVLSAGAKISVSAIHALMDEGRIRGRIELPDGTPGYITLRYQEHVFVRPAKKKSAHASGAGIQLGPKTTDIPELAGTISESMGTVLGTTKNLTAKMGSMTTSLLYELKEDKGPPLDGDLYPIGEYILERAASITETQSHGSKQIGWMDTGTYIRVLEVVCIPKHNRIRGHMVGPGGHVGWVTLFALGQVFVRRADGPTDKVEGESIETA